MVCKLWRKCSLNSNVWTRFMSKDHQTSKSLDLVFCIDSTGSMDGEINEVKEKIISIVDRIENAKVNVMVGLVFYNDHEKVHLKFDKSPTVVYPFTDDIPLVKKNIESIIAIGGNDNAEAVADGLYEVSQLNFRPNASKICILISDAPAHGFDSNFNGTCVDYHPKGCPCGHDSIKLVRSLVRRGITFYTVSCRPTPNSSDYLNAIASISEGKCVNLTSSEMLSDFIVGSAQDAIYLDSISARVRHEVEHTISSYPELSIDECIYRATYKLRSQGVMMKDSSKTLQLLNQEKHSKYSLILQSDSDKDFLKKYDQFLDTLAKSKILGYRKQEIESKKSIKLDKKQSSDGSGLLLINIPYVRKICKKYLLI